jgi:hypothetical protein
MALLMARILSNSKWVGGIVFALVFSNKNKPVCFVFAFKFLTKPFKNKGFK